MSGTALIGKPANGVKSKSTQRQAHLKSGTGLVADMRGASQKPSAPTSTLQSSIQSTSMPPTIKAQMQGGKQRNRTQLISPSNFTQFNDLQYLAQKLGAAP